MPAGRVPTHACKVIDSRYIGLLRRINYPVLKEQDKSAARLCPWSRHLPNTMLRAFDPGKPTVNIRPKLTCIKMPPYALFAVIIYAYFLLTLERSSIQTSTRPAPESSLTLDTLQDSLSPSRASYPPGQRTGNPISRTCLTTGRLASSFKTTWTPLAY